MKIKHIETKKIFDTPGKALCFYCLGKNCFDCAINSQNRPDDETCESYVKNYPAEALKKMGFEIIGYNPISEWTLAKAQQYCQNNANCENCEIMKVTKFCPFVLGWREINFKQPLLNTEDIECLETIRKMFVNVKSFKLRELVSDSKKDIIFIGYDNTPFTVLTIDINIFANLNFDQVYDIAELLEEAKNYEAP